MGLAHGTNCENMKLTEPWRKVCLLCEFEVEGLSAVTRTKQQEPVRVLLNSLRFDCVKSSVNNEAMNC